MLDKRACGYLNIAEVFVLPFFAFSAVILLKCLSLRYLSKNTLNGNPLINEQSPDKSHANQEWSHAVLVVWAKLQRLGK